MFCWAFNTSSASQGSVSIAGSPTPIVQVNTWAQSERWGLQLQSKHTKLELLYTIKQCSLHRLSWPVKNLHSRLILFRGVAVSSRPGGWEPSLLSTQALLKTLLWRAPPNCWTFPGHSRFHQSSSITQQSRAAKNRAGKEFRWCQDPIVPKNSETTT